MLAFTPQPQIYHGTWSTTSLTAQVEASLRVFFLRGCGIHTRFQAISLGLLQMWLQFIPRRRLNSVRTLCFLPFCLDKWEGWDSNPLTQWERIYSPPQLSNSTALPYDATYIDLQLPNKVLLTRLSPQSSYLTNFYCWSGGGGTRTHTPKHQFLRLACLPFHHAPIVLSWTEGARTLDPLINSQMLLPAELRSNIQGNSIFNLHSYKKPKSTGWSRGKRPRRRLICRNCLFCIIIITYFF